MTCFRPIKCWQKTCFTFPQNRYFRTSYWTHIEIEKGEIKPLFTEKQKEIGRKIGLNENILNAQYQESRYTKKPVFITGPIRNNIESNLIAIGTEAKKYKKLLFKKPTKYTGEIAPFYRELQIPCGKCIGCLLDKANDWATRAYLESKNWKNNCFITLTYNDENLPKNRSLAKKDLQDFWKRLRYYYQGKEYWDNPRTNKHENPIRYIVAGEYGPKTLRPHYHALVFNWKPDDLKYYKTNHNGDILYTSKKLEKIWGNGFVIIGEVTYESACYVSRYVMKKAFNNKKPSAVTDLREKEFIETSRNGGIGILKWISNKAEIIMNQGIFIKIKGKVKLKQIPKFFMRKWKESDDWENYERYQYKRQQQGKQNWQNILKNTSLNESQYLKQQEYNLLEKAKILKRDNLI